MDNRHRFYQKTIKKLIPDTHARILVCGGGKLDFEVLQNLKFKHVTISNLDTRMKGDEYHPFQWKFEDAEKLSFDDNSFDYCIIHAAIHHASSPHKVVIEMYRVASKGVLAFESRDSLVMRLLEKLNLTQTYEHAAVYFNDGKYGGVNNSEIPNYIYRWTEREVEKTINTYSPCYKHEFKYRYGTAFPCTPELEKNGWFKLLLLNILRPCYMLFALIFPRQQNQFAFYITKPNPKTQLFPWLKHNTKSGKIGFNMEWAEKKYKQGIEPS